MPLPFPRAPGYDRLLIGLFFCGLLLLGIKLTPDYGLYIDEFTNHVFGLTWYDYVREIVTEGAPIAALQNGTTHDIVHGPVFEMALAWFGREVLGLVELREFVLFRHYGTWATFYLTVIAVYFLARRLGSNRFLAVLAGLFLVMQPRIFSHAFYDSVDISFLAFYSVSILTLIRYLDRRNLTALILHAITCALAIGVRSIGGVIPAITVAILVIELILRMPPTSRVKMSIVHLACFPIMVAVVTLATWPFLWNHPLERILEVLRVTPQVGWGGTVLYLGEVTLATELPWHYLPVWILITTPLVISGLFLVGLGELTGSLLHRPVTVLRDRLPEIVVVGAIILPLGAVILLRAEVYDSWRHLFFISPAVALIAVGGLRQCMTWIDRLLPTSRARTLKRLGAVLIALSLVQVGWKMITLHPYQNVYFNRLAGKNLTTIKAQFEVDYWALSYLEALQHLVSIHPTGLLKIYHGQNTLLAINRHGLPPADRDRIRSVELDEAEYVLTTYRTARNGFPDLEEIYSVEAEGAKIATLYRKTPMTE